MAIAGAGVPSTEDATVAVCGGVKAVTLDELKYETVSSCVATDYPVDDIALYHGTLIGPGVSVLILTFKE